MGRWSEQRIEGTVPAPESDEAIEQALRRAGYRPAPQATSDIALRGYRTSTTPDVVMRFEPRVLSDLDVRAVHVWRRDDATLAYLAVLPPIGLMQVTAALVAVGAGGGALLGIRPVELGVICGMSIAIVLLFAVQHVAAGPCLVADVQVIRGTPTRCPGDVQVDARVGGDRTHVGRVRAGTVFGLGPVDGEIRELHLETMGLTPAAGVTLVGWAADLASCY